MLCQIILWRFFVHLIWLTLFVTCSVIYTYHRIDRFPIWKQRSWDWYSKRKKEIFSSTHRMWTVVPLNQKPLWCQWAMLTPNKIKKYWCILCYDNEFFFKILVVQMLFCVLHTVVKKKNSFCPQGKYWLGKLKSIGIILLFLRLSIVIY